MVPPVCPNPRPAIIGTDTPKQATKGAKTNEILSPIPPVECLSTKQGAGLVDDFKASQDNRFPLWTMQFVKIGLLSLLFGASIIASFETFPVLAVGMAFIGTGLGLCMPAISAGASLAVSPAEQGGAAGLVVACPAIGFVTGPVAAGALYQLHGPLAPLFSATVFFVVLVTLAVKGR